jgi:hypothetical protein
MYPKIKLGISKRRWLKFPHSCNGPGNSRLRFKRPLVDSGFDMTALHQTTMYLFRLPSDVSHFTLSYIDEE